MKKIRLFKPSLGIAELKSVKRVFKKSWIGQGNEVLLFEDKFKNKFKSKYALAFNSCSAALQLAVNSLKLPKGSRIMVNNLTFAASIQCILHNELIPVLIDCDKTTLGFNLEDAKKKISKNVRAIIVVHYGGYPSKIDEIVKFAKKNLVELEAINKAVGDVVGDDLHVQLLGGHAGGGGAKRAHVSALPYETRPSRSTERRDRSLAFSIILVTRS